MEALLDRLSSGQIVAVISILAGGIVAVSMIWAITKYQLQALTEESALQRERQKADLALRERLVASRVGSGEKVPLEELLALGMSDPAPGNTDAELAKRFGMLETDADTIERALRQAMATDPARKKLIVEVMDGLIVSDASPEAVLAAVRPLCGAAKEHLAESVA